MSTLQKSRSLVEKLDSIGTEVMDADEGLFFSFLCFPVFLSLTDPDRNV